GDEESAEDEVIELVELMEADEGEDRTRELTVKNRLDEKPAVRPAQPAAAKEPMSGAPSENMAEDEEDAELDLSDLTLDFDMEPARPTRAAGEEEITEADLENLLKETSSEEITFEPSGDEGSLQAGKEEEVADADLEALLQEATVEGLEEAKDEAEVLEIVSEVEAAEQVRLEEEKPALKDIESLVGSFEETRVEAEPLMEPVGQTPARVDLDQPMASEEALKEEIATEQPSVEKLAGISEERLEEIVTKVVREVVERVARDTMASVAEKVIGQAIEALKASLENPSEDS
ncbi:MAG: hypothetical protein ACM335_08025, partial [Deltaproteobacteria bacterium]